MNFRLFSWRPTRPTDPPAAGNGVYRGKWNKIELPNGQIGWALTFTPPLNVPGRSKTNLRVPPPPPDGPEEFNLEIKFQPI